MIITILSWQQNWLNKLCFQGTKIARYQPTKYAIIILTNKEVKAKMVQFRSCPRCTGDMKTTQDMYGNYKECLQCGFMQDIPSEVKKRTDWMDSGKKPRKKTEAA